MKTIVFQGQSQNDVLRNFSRHLAEAFVKEGHEILLWDMLNYSIQDYLKTIHEFKPDFTIGFNPVTYTYEEQPLFKYTKIPHMVYLVDNPFYHVYQRALVDPNDPLVFTLSMEFDFMFEFLHVKRTSNQFSFGASSSLAERFPYYSFRPFSLIFAGGLTLPYMYEKQIRENFAPLLGRKLLDFINIIKEWILENQAFIPVPIEQWYLDYMNLNVGDFNEEKYQFIISTLPLIEGYYRNFMRLEIVKKLSSTGLDLHIIGPDIWKDVLHDYKQIRYYPSVNYQEYLELMGQSKMNLNVSPMFFRMHDRLPATMMTGSILCTSILPKLIDEHPQLLEMSLIYNYGTLEDTSSEIMRLLSSDEERIEVARLSQEYARSHFSWETVVKDLIKIYHNVF